MGNFECITCNKGDKSKILNECKKEFLRHHPELEGLKITESFMIRKLIDYYLGR